MKSIQHLICLTFLLLSFYSCVSQNSNFGIEREIVVKGKIRHFDNHTDHQTIQIVRRDFFGRNEKCSSIINEDGNFRIAFQSAYVQEFYLDYGNLFSLVCKPGDSLILEIDADVLNHTNTTHLNGAYFIKFAHNELGKANQEISKFMEELPNDKYRYQYEIDAETNKSPIEFLQYIHLRENEYYSFLEGFIVRNNTTKLLKEWAYDHIKYESWNDLMRYRWTHPYYRKMKEDSFHLSLNYFSFLKDYDMNDNKMFTVAHADFLHELSTYSMRNPKDSLAKVRLAYSEKKYIEGTHTLKNMILANSSGFTRDLFFAQFYVNILKGQQLAIFETIYDPGFTTQKYFLRIIDKEYRNLKKDLSNNNTEGANITSLKSKITSQLIDSITFKFKNKVIYIDFWAPWCGPCMAEMPFSKDIQEHFKNRNVVFLFLASRCNENSWRSTIANKKLTGEHIFLTDDQFNVLASNLEIMAIPHYSLIDKNGKIILKNAPPPSEKIKLINEIEKLID